MPQMKRFNSFGSNDHIPLQFDLEGPHKSAAKLRNGVAFWLFGLANNFPFVVMLSAANDILSRNNPGLGTGVVLLADILPDLVVKACLPFFMSKIPFAIRILIVVIFSALSFLTVSFSQVTWLSLLGVASGSFATGLGEITFLALTSYYDKSTISYWSSGTGGAGLFGALSYLGFTLIVSPSTALLMMLFCPGILLISYLFVLLPPNKASAHTQVDDPAICAEQETSLPNQMTALQPGAGSSSGALDTETAAPAQPPLDDHHDATDADIEKAPLAPSAPSHTMLYQLKQMGPLLKYVLPLLTVYFGAYLINQGMYENVYWNNEFIDKGTQYRVFQTLYRLGVFISRSTRGLYAINRVWIPAALEAVNVVVMGLDARFQFFPSIWFWFVLTVYEGLLAGATYVNAFVMVSANAPQEHSEFCMGAAAFGGSIGIASAGGVAIAVNQGLRGVGGR
eukprot:m.41501 g.41501  ORF g.41501 m.41501 type:complete len:452 (+) comp10511_c0_seq3:151-1506(+)